MGCQNSKEDGSGGGKAANNASHEAKQNGGAGTGSPPPIDPRLPLNPRQLFLLKKSWKGVKRNMEATGVEMFIGLFKRNEELKDLFIQFRNMGSTSDDLRNNEEVERHGKLVMDVFDECISHLDDVDYVETVCKRTGEAHAHFSGFYPGLFWNMEEPFLEALKIILQDRYTDQMDVIYQLTVKFILASLNKACKDASS